ncbi:SRPBCC family protein [Nocardioides ochotonae]|uniref:SRPBCC family protein n=1 Tax=Nocardioides ochotonae TaxID=2685869 RepID=UPI00140ACFA3|nr:SRPBCC family protein [Nocardioides ochotonae]
MTTQHRTTTRIDAPVATVWEVLSDVERMPQWTPSMRSVRILAGDGLAIGTAAEIRQPGMPVMTWTVDQLTPGQHFRWWARSAGVTTYGDHALAPTADGGTEATLAVEQAGPLAWLLGALTMRRTARYVDQELAGLARASEAAARNAG